MTDLQRWALLGAVLLLGALAAAGALALWPVQQPPARLGDYEQLWSAMDTGALAVLEELAQRDDGLGWQAARAAGSARAQRGEYAQASVWLARALALWPTAEVRLGYARALEASGSYAQALHQWELLLPREDAARAVVRLAGDSLEAAQLLNRRGVHAQALELASTLSTNAGKLEAARALAGLGSLPEAISAYRDYLRSTPDRPAQAELGRLLERSGELEAALNAYRAAGAAGGLAAGRLLESLGRTEEAIQSYRSSTDPEAMWRAAVLLERTGHASEALSLYRTLAGGEHRVWDDAALRAYILLSQRGDRQETRSMLESLPPAARYLLGRDVGIPVPSPRSDPPRTKPRAVEMADRLLAYLPVEEAWGWAQAELEVALRGASPADRLAIGEWYLAHGDYAAACRVGVAVLSERPSLRAYRLAYPQAWAGEVTRWADEYGVDPLVVWAVMREESHFRAQAISGSDARGVMQLLPTTARWIAEDRLGILFGTGSLFEPTFNIRLGTWYLGYLGEQFPQDRAWAVAAYNGGQGNLRRWTHPELPLHDLPAALGSVETREYVSKVLHTWLVYRWLYGD